MNFSIAVQDSVSKPPRLPYRQAALRTLGEKYNLEMVVAKSAFMKTINTTYRRKKKTTNVLSFALSRTEGQIFLDPKVIGKEASVLGVSARSHFWNMYIHGILHLKGFDHGVKMEAAERRLLRFFSLGKKARAL